MFVSDGSSVALAKISEGLDELLTAGLEPCNSRSAVAVIEAVESAGRRLAAVQSELVRVVDSRAQFAADGHGSAKVMVRHVAKLSGGEAASRAKTAKMLTDLDAVAARFRAGELGVDQVRVLARVHANPRVRRHMDEAQRWFIKIANRLSFPDFEAAVRQWERLVDTDGPEPRSFLNRSASLLQNGIDLSWELRGSFGSMQGAPMDEILEHYISAETLADWDKARAEHGDDATAAHLPRTATQRRADALWQIFQDAATNPNSAVSIGFVHNIVWNSQGYEEMLRRLAGADPQPLHPESFRCTTINGTPVDPREAAADSLIHRIRRVVTNAAGVVIDQGRARTFTGSARLAVLLADTKCTWPGCWTPANHCQIDHSQPHATGGKTNPRNGSPQCGRHNRYKEHGYTVWRDPAGIWHTIRPDGTEIE